MNKKLVITVILLIQIGFIWRCIIAPAVNGTVEQQQEETQQVQELSEEETQQVLDSAPEVSAEENIMTSVDFIADFASIVVEDQAVAQDTPWKKNVGLITLDDGSECLFLTPNTGMTTPALTLEEGKMEMNFCIFETVRGNSDGAGILLQVFDAEGTLVKEENIFVDAIKEWQEYSCDLSEVTQEIITVRIVGNNGGNDDDVCDWIMLNKCNIK